MVASLVRKTTMNMKHQPTVEQKQVGPKQPGGDEQKRRDEEQFWADWWREYAQTWK